MSPVFVGPNATASRALTSTRVALSVRESARIVVNSALFEGSNPALSGKFQAEFEGEFRPGPNWGARPSVLADLLGIGEGPLG
jgi:hypothetical protein